MASLVAGWCTGMVDGGMLLHFESGIVRCFWGGRVCLSVGVEDVFGDSRREEKVNKMLQGGEQHNSVHKPCYNSCVIYLL